MKTILVTGANRGIGLEICRQLSELGHQVILASRDYQKGQRAAAGLSSPVHVRQLDVCNEQSIQALFTDLSRSFGKLDVLINNAAIGSTDASQENSLTVKLGRMLPAELRRLIRKTGVKPAVSGPADIRLGSVQYIMETNFYGPWRMVQIMLPLLMAASPSRIINISSGMGQLNNLNGLYPGYSISKAALNALTVMLSKDLIHHGIAVNAMCPGWVRTDMGGPDAPRSIPEGADTAVWLATESKIPTGMFFRDRQSIPW